MPLVRQLPKRGFKNHFATNYAGVNVSKLEVFENGAVVDAAALKEMAICKKQLDGVKILGGGKLTKSLTVRAAAFSESAKQIIEAAGGKAEVV
jgi:large subunit ribosomal protein L15